MDDEAVAEGLTENLDMDGFSAKAYEEQRKKEEIAYKKQKRQEIKLACVQQAISMWLSDKELNVIAEAKKIYEFVRS